MEVAEIQARVRHAQPREEATMKTNTQLQVDVMEELQYEPIVDAAGIGISAKDGIVTLTGTVNSLAEKWAVSHAAERIGGVKAVVNVLNWDLMVPDEKIKVDVHEGWIILEGTVDHKHQRKAAENAIRNITGVKGVSNLINLKPETIAPGG